MKRSKNQNKAILIIGLLLVLVTAAVTTVAVVNQLNSSKTKAVHQPVATTNPVQAVRNLVTTKYADTVKLNDQFGASVTYHVAGYDFAPSVVNSAANSAKMSPTSTASTTTTANLPQTLPDDVTATLGNLGYTQTTSGAYDPGIHGIGAYKATYFVKGDSVCEWFDAVYEIEFTCVGKQRLEQVAQAAQPFAGSIAQALGAKLSQVALYSPLIETNKQNPSYEHAHANYMGPSGTDGIQSLQQADALFYRPVGAQQWIYTLSTQEGIGCWQISGAAALAYSDICSKDGF